MKIIFIVTGEGKMHFEGMYKSKEFDTYKEAEDHIDWIKIPGEYQIQKIYVKK